MDDAKWLVIMIIVIWAFVMLMFVADDYIQSMERIEMAKIK